METVQHSARETVEVVDGVHLTQLAVGERASVQHFHIEPGAAVPAHSHDHEQVGYVSKGTFMFLVGGEIERVDGSGEAGDVGGEAAVVDGDDGVAESEAGDGATVTEHTVGPGDSYCVPAGERHAAENRSEVPVDGIDVFAPPRTNPDWMD